MAIAQTLDITDQQVLDFLHKYPDFLKKHPELLAVLTPPSRELGGSGGVVDFQEFQLKSLQKNSKNLKSKLDGLVDFCRDNLSVQSQVHEAVMRLTRARNLEQLLEVITIDMVSLFDVDVVRLAVESEAAEFYETYYTEHNYSGIVFVPPGTTEAMTAGRKAQLIEDARATPLPGFDDIFADCNSLIQSYALLKLELDHFVHDVLLVFGVRKPGRFHPGQAVDFLSFLAKVVAIQLDAYLDDMTPV
jgi:uncharacterized protein